MKGTLADGRKVEFDVFAAKVTWHGNEKRVAVLDSGGGNLIGMSMLKGSRVTIDVADDGTVQIEPLSPQNRRVRRRRQG